MELVITCSADGKHSCSELRRIFLALGFVSQENYLNMFKQQSMPPVELMNRRNIVLFLSGNNEFQQSMFDYIRNFTNPLTTYIIYNHDDAALIDFIAERKYKHFKTTKQSLLQEELFSNILEWSSTQQDDYSRFPFQNDFFIEPRFVPVLKQCVIHELKRGTSVISEEELGELKELALQCPYFLYFKSKIWYDLLSEELKKAESANNDASRDEIIVRCKSLLTDLNGYINSFNEFTRFYVLKGFIKQYMLKEPRCGVMYYEKAYYRNPFNAYLPFYVGAALLASDSIISKDQIKKYFNVALTNNSVFYQAYFKLARLYEALDNLDQALFYYKSILNVLSFSEECGFLTQDEKKYIWKANYFICEIYIKKNSYQNAVIYLDKLIKMKESGFLLNGTGFDNEYRDATASYLIEKKQRLLSKK